MKSIKTKFSLLMQHKPQQTAMSIIVSYSFKWSINNNTYCNISVEYESSQI